MVDILDFRLPNLSMQTTRRVGGARYCFMLYLFVKPLVYVTAAESVLNERDKLRKEATELKIKQEREERERKLAMLAALAAEEDPGSRIPRQNVSMKIVCI